MQNRTWIFLLVLVLVFSSVRAASFTTLFADVVLDENTTYFGEFQSPYIEFYLTPITNFTVPIPGGRNISNNTNLNFTFIGHYRDRRVPRPIYLRRFLWQNQSNVTRTIFVQIQNGTIDLGNGTIVTTFNRTQVNVTEQVWVNTSEPWGRPLTKDVTYGYRVFAPPDAIDVNDLEYIKWTACIFGTCIDPYWASYNEIANLSKNWSTTNYNPWLFQYFKANATRINMTQNCAGTSGSQFQCWQSGESATTSVGLYPLSYNISWQVGAAGGINYPSLALKYYFAAGTTGNYTFNGTFWCAGGSFCTGGDGANWSVRLNGSATALCSGQITTSGSSSPYNCEIGNNVPGGSFVELDIEANAGNEFDFGNFTAIIYGSQLRNNVVNATGIDVNVSKTGADRGAPVLHYAVWSDSVALSSYIFSSNYSGVWVNDTPIAFAQSNNSWSNVSKFLPVITHTWGWQIYANNTDNVFNSTGIQTIAVVNRSQVRDRVYISRSNRLLQNTTLSGTQTPTIDVVNASIDHWLVVVRNDTTGSYSIKVNGNNPPGNSITGTNTNRTTVDRFNVTAAMLAGSNTITYTITGSIEVIYTELDEQANTTVFGEQKNVTVMFTTFHPFATLTTVNASDEVTIVGAYVNTLIQNNSYGIVLLNTTSFSTNSNLNITLNNSDGADNTTFNYSFYQVDATSPTVVARSLNKTQIDLGKDITVKITANVTDSHIANVTAFVTRSNGTTFTATFVQSPDGNYTYNYTAEGTGTASLRVDGSDTVGHLTTGTPIFLYVSNFTFTNSTNNTQLAINVTGLGVTGAIEFNTTFIFVTDNNSTANLSRLHNYTLPDTSPTFLGCYNGTGFNVTAAQCLQVSASVIQLNTSEHTGNQTSNYTISWSAGTYSAQWQNGGVEGDASRRYFQAFTSTTSLVNYVNATFTIRTGFNGTSKHIVGYVCTSPSAARNFTCVNGVGSWEEIKYNSTVSEWSAANTTYGVRQFLAFNNTAQGNNTDFRDYLWLQHRIISTPSTLLMYFETVDGAESFSAPGGGPGDPGAAGGGGAGGASGTPTPTPGELTVPEPQGDWLQQLLSNLGSFGNGIYSGTQTAGVILGGSFSGIVNFITDPSNTLAALLIVVVSAAVFFLTSSGSSNRSSKPTVR